MDASNETAEGTSHGLASSVPPSRYSDDPIMERSSPLAMRPRPLSSITQSQVPEQAQWQIHYSLSAPISSSSSSFATLQAETPQPSNHQHFATPSAEHKFTIGMQRITTLISHYSHTSPEMSHHLEALKNCLMNLPLPLDNRRTSSSHAREDEDADVEKTRPWKFRFLDLIIEMMLDEKEMGEMDVMNVLLYAEAVMRGLRGRMVERD
jgi:hypothetical protein